MLAGATRQLVKSCELPVAWRCTSPVRGLPWRHQPFKPSDAETARATLIWGGPCRFSLEAQADKGAGFVKSCELRPVTRKSISQARRKPLYLLHFRVDRAGIEPAT